MERGLVAFGPWDEAWDEEGQDRRDWGFSPRRSCPLALSSSSFIVIATVSMKIPDLQGCVILRPQGSMTRYFGWSESPWRSSDIHLDRASVLGLFFPPN